MEPVLRGLMEKALDHLLDKKLEHQAGLINRLELLIQSKEDYLRGFVVGYMVSACMTLSSLTHEEETTESTNELYDRVISGRHAEIEQKIQQTLSR